MTAHLLTDGVATANGGPDTRSTPSRPARQGHAAWIHFLGGRARDTVVRSRDGEEGPTSQRRGGGRGRPAALVGRRRRQRRRPHRLPRRWRALYRPLQLVPHERRHRGLRLLRGLQPGLPCCSSADGEVWRECETGRGEGAHAGEAE
jgi:hypothetical protein